MSKRKERGPNQPLNDGQPWTDSDNDYIRLAYGTVTVKDIAANLQRTKAATQAHMNQMNLPRRPVVCANCQQPLEQPARGRPRRFCDDPECARLRETQLRHQRKPPHPLVQRQCLSCQAPFTTNRHDHVHCSKKCLQRTWYESQKAYIRRSSDEPQVHEDIVEQLRDPNASLREVARRTGAPLHVVQRALRETSAPPTHTDKTDAFIVANFGSMTATQIAQHLNMRATQVHGRIGWMRRHGQMNFRESA